MFGFLRKVFDRSKRRRRNAGAVMALDDVADIERELERVGRGHQAARLLNRAGDLYMAQGDRQNALKRYGDAIDAYLQAGEYDNAMAVCRKIIRVVPEVIRTRRTLAWLCLGKGFLEIAREHIDAYTKASLEAGLAPLAIQHLRLMAQYVDRAEFRGFLAGRLEELGDVDGARRVREGKAVDQVRQAGWGPVVFAAMLTPEELRQAVEKGVEICPPTDEAARDAFDTLLIDVEGEGTPDRQEDKGGSD
jgi:tetratricopeptide (TPR) repeat protein